MSDRPFWQPYWYEFCKLLIRGGALLVFRARFSGMNHVPPEGPVLVVSNHQSHLDPPLVGCGFPRPMHFLARQTLFKSPLFARLIASVNALPIDREGGGLAGIKATLRLLKSGQAVLIFPEGTRTPDGRIRPFMPGFTTLATRSGAAIVPAAIEGAFQAWPRARRFPRPGPVHVHYGPPLLPDDYRGMTDRQLLAEVERRVQDAHAQLLQHPAFRR